MPTNAFALTFLAVAAIVALSLLLLGVRLLVGKDFVKTDIADSAALKERGIDCVLDQNRTERVLANGTPRNRKKRQTKNSQLI